MVKTIKKQKTIRRNVKKTSRYNNYKTNKKTTRRSATRTRATRTRATRRRATRRRATRRRATRRRATRRRATRRRATRRRETMTKPKGSKRVWSEIKSVANSLVPRGVGSPRILEKTERVQESQRGGGERPGAEEEGEHSNWLWTRWEETKSGAQS